MFTTEIYQNVKKPRYTQLQKTAIPIICIGVVLVLLSIADFMPNKSIFSLLGVGTFLVFAVLNIYAIVSVEEHTKELIGTLNFTKNHLMWNGKKIPWDSIKEADFICYDYYGRYVNSLNQVKLRKNLSAGIDNKIRILTFDNEEFEANFKLFGEAEIETLNRVLWNIIKSNRILLEVGRVLVAPKNQEEKNILVNHCC